MDKWAMTEPKIYNSSLSHSATSVKGVSSGIAWVWLQILKVLKDKAFSNEHFD
jgi:hypothetical protein